MSNSTPGSSTTSRLDVMEHRVESVERAIKDLTHSVRDAIAKMAEQRPPIPFKEIVVTIVACLSILGVIAKVADHWQEQTLQLHAAKQSAQYAVYEYRIQQLEHRLAQLPRP